jgi:hypothetical protein
MKIIPVGHAILFALLVCCSGLGPARAQTNATDVPKPPPSILDNDELAQLQKVRAQVLGAHPDLQSEEEKLTAFHNAAQNPATQPTPEQRNAMFVEWKAYQKKMRAEMLKIDPTLKPLFAKLDESRKHGGPSPFQPATTK